MKTTVRALSLRLVASALTAALAACADQPAPPVDAGAEAPAWTVPPRVASARREGGTVILSGQAQPGGRVVMRALDGAAHAVTADDRGAFSLRVAAGGDLFLTPEGQAGQAGLPGPDRIVILDGGPAVALSPGSPSRRLDAAVGFSALDSDGAMAVLSGRAQPGAQVTVELGGGSPLTATAGGDGRWSVGVSSERLGATVTVDGRRHALPVAAAATPGVTQVEGGWLIVWTTPDGARTLTWVPRDG